ncbi:ATP-binding protein [Actinocorallia sp. B10E7]|uniref:ATP-binding protein n=1 Tax=Actinocorallia sp. B10E7 TaxID=3153558 RepID=UPI00325EF0A1
MTTPQASLVPAHVTRFLLLAELCRTLGEHGCSSCLVNPAFGSAVLRVAREGRHGEWLDVGSVERADDWVLHLGGAVGLGMPHGSDRPAHRPNGGVMTVPRAAAAFPGTPDQAATVRRWFTAWLGAEHPAADTAALLLSEVFSNACLHSRSAEPGGTVDVVAEVAGRIVSVEVTDGGGGPESLTADAPPNDAENGRGLWLLDLLSKEWGSAPLPDGRFRVHYTVAF